MRWVDELAAAAEGRLAPAVYEYFRRGTTAERTRAEAVDSWDRLRLRPHMPRDVSSVSTATTVLGTPVRTPVLVAPTTLQRQCDPAGEAATARGAAAAGSLLCVTSNTGVPFADLPAAGAPWWVQAYLIRDRAVCAKLLAQAREAGASAVVLTVDAPVVGRPYPDGLAALADVVPPEHRGANWPDDASRNAPHAADVTLDDIGWAREVSGLPVVVKGLLRGDDARAAVAAGASAVVVSNHGGRQLDGAVSSVYALPEIVDALAGTGAEVYVDGGIRRGEHVLAALALGARAVFLGRPVLWALAVGGDRGVRRLLSDLTEEFAHALALAGATGPAGLDRDLVVAG